MTAGIFDAGAVPAGWFADVGAAAGWFAPEALTGAAASTAPSIRAGFPVVAPHAAAAPPYDVLSDVFSANAGDELAAYAIGAGLPTVVSRNSANTGAGTLEWKLRLVTRSDILNHSLEADGGMQVAIYTCVVPAGGVTERALYTTPTVANEGGTAVWGSHEARLMIIACDNTNGIGAIAFKGSMSAGAGGSNDITTGSAATQTIKPFAADSLCFGAGIFANGTAPTAASGCTEVVAPGTGRMPLYSRSSAGVGTPLAIGSSVTDSTVWAIGLIEYLPTTVAKPALKLLALGDSGIESTNSALQTAVAVQDALAPAFELFSQGVWWAHTGQTKARWDSEKATLPPIDVAIVQVGMNDVSENGAWNSTSQSNLASIYTDLAAAGIPIAAYTGIGPLATPGAAPAAYYAFRDWVTANAPSGSHLYSLDLVTDPAQGYLAVYPAYLSSDGGHISAAGNAIYSANIATWIGGLPLGGNAAVLEGAALVVATAAGQLTTQIRLAGSAVSVSGAPGALTAQIRLTGAAIAQAAAAAGLTSAIPLSGAGAVAAAAGAVLTAQIRLTGGAAATAGAAATLTTAIPLSGAAIATAIAAGGLTAQINLAGAATAVVSASADLSAAGGSAALAGTATGQSTASAWLATGIPITGAALGVGTATGSMTTGIRLAGSAASVSTASGQLLTSVVLSGAALAEAVSSAAMAAGIIMTAQAVTQAAAAGTLATAIRLIGAATAQASATGNLLAGSGLSGSAAAQAAASATLSVQIQFSAAAIAQAAATAGLATAIRLGGAAADQANADGVLTTAIPLTAQSIAQAITTGGLTAQIRLTGAATAAGAGVASLWTQITIAGQALSVAAATANLDTTASHWAQGPIWMRSTVRRATLIESGATRAVAMTGRATAATRYTSEVRRAQ